MAKPIFFVWTLMRFDLRAHSQNRPFHLYLGLVAGLFVYGSAARSVVDLVRPTLSEWGLRIALDWLMVVLAIGLVAWLGWWRKTRLTAPTAPGGLKYLLLLAALVVVPFVAVVVAVPNWFVGGVGGLQRVKRLYRRGEFRRVPFHRLVVESKPIRVGCL